MKMVNSLTAEECEMLILMAEKHEVCIGRYDRLEDRDVAKLLRERDLAKAPFYVGLLTI